MKFYTTQHPYYCGIDLHARSLYVCILDANGETILHREIKALPEPLLNLLTPYIGNIVVGVECMHCWYWVSDFCTEHGIDFILGHALYMKALHGGKAKNDRIDSYKIAYLIRGGNFPLAYVYPAEMRSARDLLRRRTRLVRHGADLKAHVKNTVSQYNLPPNNLDLKYPCAREAMRDCFDDQKSQTYGLGSNAHGTYKRERLEVLLLLAALANWLHYMIGLAAELAGMHLRFQANSIKHRRVLSFNYLGRRLCKVAKLGLNIEQIQAAIRQIMLWAAESDWAAITLEKS